jgi:hypothetical protein
VAIPVAMGRGVETSFGRFEKTRGNGESAPKKIKNIPDSFPLNQPGFPSERCNRYPDLPILRATVKHARRGNGLQRILVPQATPKSQRGPESALLCPFLVVRGLSPDFRG